MVENKNTIEYLSPGTELLLKSDNIDLPINRFFIILLSSGGSFMMKYFFILLAIICISLPIFAQEAAKIKAAQSMNSSRAYHEGIYVSIEGAYLVCGGKNGSSYLDSCEFFSNQNQSWSQGFKMKVARKNPPLANIFALSKQGSEKGSILIPGGEDSSGNPVINVDFYDIQSKSVDQFKQLPAAHSQGIVSFNPTQEPLILAVLIGPGTHITKLVIANNDINWVQSTKSLQYPRDGHRFTGIPDYKILVVGGGSKVLETYDYKNDVVSPSKELPSDIKGHQIINLSDSTILIAGGTDENGGFIKDTFIYNPLNDTLTTVGSLNFPRKDFRLTLLHNNKVLASGGIGEDGKTVSRLEIFDPTTNKWTTSLDLITARANHTAELIGPDGVLICGGNSGETTPALKSCEIYTPEKICTPGQFMCDGNWIIKCNSYGDGTNRTNECAGGCKDGQCIGGCTEGERRCRDIGVKIIVEICNSTGGWVLLEQCEESCKNGYCDGQIPPKDTGILDTGKDTSSDNNQLTDNSASDETNEDILVQDDAGNFIDSTQIMDNYNGQSDQKSSDGCSCNLIEF